MTTASALPVDIPDDATALSGSADKGGCISVTSIGLNEEA